LTCAPGVRNAVTDEKKALARLELHDSLSN
jgi:hypothetical protein